MHETFSPLYRQVFESFGPGDGTRYGNYRTQDAAQQLIKDAEAKARAEGRPITGYRALNYTDFRSDSQRSMQVPMFGQTEEETLGPIRAEQQRLAGIQQQLYETQQADIAKNLKIVQEEKSAVSKLMEDYTALTIKEADARRKAQEEAQTALKTSTQNRLMEGRSASLRINPSESGPRTGGGSQQFRRRTSQFGATAPYKGLNLTAPGAVNI